MHYEKGRSADHTEELYKKHLHVTNHTNLGEETMHGIKHVRIDKCQALSEHWKP